MLDLDVIGKVKNVDIDELVIGDQQYEKYYKTVKEAWKVHSKFSTD